MTVTSVDKDPDCLHDDHHGRVRRPGRARLAGLGRPPPARAVVGPADVAGDRRRARPAPRGPGHLLHDRARGREVRRLVGRRRGRRPAPARASRTASPTTAGKPNTDMPTTTHAASTLDEPTAAAPAWSMASTFPSTEAMEQMIAMGMEEGIAPGPRPDRRHPRRLIPGVCTPTLVPVAAVGGLPPVVAPGTVGSPGDGEGPEGVLHAGLRGSAQVSCSGVPRRRTRRPRRCPRRGRGPPWRRAASCSHERKARASSRRSSSSRRANTSAACTSGGKQVRPR